MRRRAGSTPAAGSGDGGSGTGRATPTATPDAAPAATLVSFSFPLIVTLLGVGTFALVNFHDAAVVTAAVRHLKGIMGAASAASDPMNSDAADAKGLVTKAQLAAHDGVAQPHRPLWIALIGEVFDVTSGARFYGPEGGYKGFAGRDGSRAFKTGEFNEEGLVETLEGLDDDAHLALDDWLSFYRKDYTFVGRLAGGHYYGVDGTPTRAKVDFDRRVARARRDQAEQKARDAVFPACASRWSQAEGGEVWCEDGRSHPRKDVTFVGGKERVRCACFPDVSFSDSRQLYPGCDNTATRCKT